MDVRTRTRRRIKGWDGDIQGLEPLGHGVSGLVFGIDKRRVAKIDIGTERSIADIEIEREVYRRVKRDPDPCPYVLQCYENDNPSGLVLERCNETVRIRLRAHYKTGAPISIAKKWAYEAARGLAHIHRAGIVQGDGENRSTSINLKS
jgi:serine/threonine protein kinase